MNRSRSAHNFDPRAYHYHPWPCYDPRARYHPYYADQSMLVTNMPNPPSSTSDDRLAAARGVEYHTTHDGDVVVVQPSFEDGSSPSKGHWQSREGGGDAPESRSPSSKYGHTRNLSSHFYSATSLNDCDEDAPLDFHDDDGRKHRRIFSNDGSNPNVAHRRLNTRGSSSAVRRDNGRHVREDSAGLDILSAAADATKDELAAAAGAPAPTSWEPESRPSLGQVSTGSYEPYPPTTHSMHPPHRQRPSAGGMPYPAPPQAGYMAPPPYGHMYAPAPYYGGYPPSAYPSQQPMYDDRREYDDKDNKGPQSYSMKHPGHQPSSDDLLANMPLQMGHHRKMSSFSSIGTILGSSLFPQDAAAEQPGHHRKTSSTVSFLQCLEMGLDNGDDNFLRNLQASNSSLPADFRSMTPPKSRTSMTPPPRMPSSMPAPQQVHSDGSQDDNDDSKLAAGGTSKRVRRKCTVEGCANRVVQGGLCISHGAKRKTCKHPGCTKNVKKAGLCSTHGPARKRCDHEGCSKVAVQGGRCIAHGAKKKLCSVDNCTKQAILSGMCKKHHDQLGTGRGVPEPGYCEEVEGPSAAHKPTHTRGLSIFQDLSADAVSNLLNEDGSSAMESRGGSTGNNPW